MPTAGFWVNTSQMRKQSASNSDGATSVKPIYGENAGAAPKSARTETPRWIRTPAVIGKTSDSV